MSSPLLPAAALPLHAQQDESTPAPRADIFPVPQSVQTSAQGSMRLQGPVDLVIHGTRYEPAVAKAGALLEAQGLAWQEISEEEAKTSSNARLTLAIECEEECTTCSLVPDAAGALEKAQGYVLQTSDDENANGAITIIGTDSDGVYYGVMSLRQLFLQADQGYIAELTVSDYPDVPYRGYVEGFYGTPWTFADRTSLFEQTSLYKMNTYVYAPKDDPYHRASWREKYPADKAEEIRSLVKTAADNNMIFCWTIHPGADYNYTADNDGDGVVDDYQALLDKVDQVYSLGVRQFGIFYDDLSESVANGTLHAQTLNNVYDYLQTKYGDIKPMVTVLTRYTNSWGASVSGYFQPFMNTIHKDTLVLWTGNSTMSAITKEYFEWPKTQTGTDKDFGVWWNYPVTDYYGGHLLMGPLECVDTNVDNIASFYMNPMSEADASKVTIFSGADYSWNIEAFNARESWKRAIEELVPECPEAFARFADNLAYNEQGNGFTFHESQYLQEDIDAFSQALADNNGVREKALVLKERFAQMLTDIDAMRKIGNAGLLEEITQYLDSYKMVAEAGITMCDAMIAAVDGQYADAMSLQSEANEQITAAAARGAKAGAHVIVPLIQEGIRQTGTQAMHALYEQQDCILSRQGKTEKVGESAQGWMAENLSLAPGESVSFSLIRPENCTASIRTQAAAEDLLAEFSVDGIRWQPLSLRSEGGSLESTKTAAAAWLRLTNQSEETVLLERAGIKKPAEPVMRRASTSLPTYQNYGIANAFDGNDDTCFWSSSGSLKDSTLTLSLGGIYEISAVEVVAGINRLNTIDAFKSAQLEVSLDGMSWQSVGASFNEEDFARTEGDSIHARHSESFAPVQARYLRMRALSASDNWLKLYEIRPEMTLIQSEGPAVSSSLSPAENSRLEYAADGYENTFLEAAKEGGIEAGDYIGIDLKNLVPLYDISAVFEEGHAPASLHLEVSDDGTAWKTAGTPLTAPTADAGGKIRISLNAGGQTGRYIRLVTNAPMEETLRLCEISWNQAVLAPSGMSASTNMGTYQSNAIANAVDGNPDTRYYSNDVSHTGDYVQVDLGQSIPLMDASIFYGGDPHRAAIDGFLSTKLQISNDGSTWTDLAGPMDSSAYTLSGGRYVCSFVLDGTSARYVRFTAAKDHDSWVQVWEININDTIDTSAVRYLEGSAQIFQSGALDDGDLNTAPVFRQIQEGDTLIYPVARHDVKDLFIAQSESSTQGTTTVEVQNLQGEWILAGSLSQTWNHFAVSEPISAVKLTFDGSVTPVIYELLTVHNASEQPVQAEKSLLQMAVTYAQSAKEGGALENLNVVVRNAFESALSQANAVLDNPSASQQEVDEAWIRLCGMIHMLSFKADKSVLTDLIEQAEAVDLSGQSEEAKAAFMQALENARAVCNDENALQERIDAAVEALRTAMEGLQPVQWNLELLQLLSDTIHEADLSLYVNDKGQVDALRDLLAKADAMLADPQSQDAIDECASALHEAWIGLRLAPDESLLEALRAFRQRVSSMDFSLYSKADADAFRDLDQRIGAALDNPGLEKREAEALAGEIRALESRAKPLADSNANTGTKSAASVRTAAQAKGSLTALGASALAGILGLLTLSRRRRR